MKKIFCVIFATIFLHSMYAQDQGSYVENEFIIWLEDGVDATEFAASSNQKSSPNVFYRKG